MDPSGTFNDGGVVFGSQEIELVNRDGDTDDYIADNINLDDSSDWFVRTDENGVPNGQVGIIGVPTGSATLQLASSATKLPKMFGTFTITEVGGSTVDLVISKVGQARTANGETKVPIEFRALVGE